MAAFCLTKDITDKFLKALKSGEIDPVKMGEMTSEERHTFLEKYVGKENAKDVNALFESKLLLKNQQKGYISWAKKVGGITEPARRDIINRIQRMDKILNPEEEKAFMKDLASKKLGIDVTQEEAKKIADLSKAIEDKKAQVTDKKSRVAYGNAILDMDDYINKISHTPMSLFNNIVNISNAPRSLMSSFDFSAPLRQGFGMISHPKLFSSSFGRMFSYAFSKSAYRNLMADIITRDNYDLMKSSGLRITKLNEKLSQREEAFISTIVDKLPGLSNSERAYTGFLNKLRADAFDKFIQQAQRNGEDISKNSDTPKDIAAVINDFTGSGNIGKHDRYSGAVPLLNSIFFSPRKIAATINIFNPVNYIKLTPTARGLAIRNLIGMLGVSATVLGLAKMNGAKIQTDPTSSDFGKVILGNTRLDVSGGNANYITLLGRLITGKTTSTTTGLSQILGTGFNSTTRADIFNQYVRNKLSPIASGIADFLYGKDANGNLFNISNEAKDRLMPLVISDVLQSIQNDPSHAVLSSILDTFGVGVQTYGNSTDWNQSQTKSLQDFKNTVGQKQFNEANSKYNQLYNTWLKQTTGSKNYQNLSDTGKQSLVQKAKSQIQSQVFSDYGYVPNSAPKTDQQINEGYQIQTMLPNP